MGNCVRKGSSVEWGSDDWGSFGSGHDKTRQEEDGLLSSSTKECMHDLAAAAAAEGTEVKIKISKIELEKLLKEAELEGLSLQQVLAQLMGAAGDGFEVDRRPWRPALHTIPE